MADDSEEETRKVQDDEVKHEQVEGVEIVSLAGSVEMSTVASLDRLLRALIKKGSRKLLIDLTIVSYMVSTAFRSILNAQIRLNLVGGVMKIACPLNGSVRRVMRMTRLDEVLAVCDTRESALRAFDPGALDTR